MEYTIYFLSTGNTAAKNVLLCDRVPNNVHFSSTAFNSFPTRATNELINIDRGILVQKNGITASYSNIQDSDTARYFPAGSDPTSIYPSLNCSGSNDNGAIVVRLGDLPQATALGTPNAYGWVRFRGRVK